MCGDEIAMGPGKADLLDAIIAHGSISAAAKAMGMSYRRAWLLVDAMNRCWTGPLVETVAGGSKERGARVTPLGQDVLQRYRAIQDDIAGCAAQDFGQGLAALIAPAPTPASN
ncbi:MAG: LysR family transcriptional regulator [Novosphingobium sp.]|nr:LysR family transcriptional regulator [Novosphingobium sp.]